MHSNDSAALVAGERANGRFATTHWSVIFQAREGQGLASAEALERLCREYWRPLYAYIRREGHGAEEAKDLTQEFFRHLFEKEWLNRLTHRDGRFRSFLLTFLRHFLSDQRDRARARKRGGGAQLIPLDDPERSEQELLEISDGLTPAQAFDRCWLRCLHGQAVARLETEYLRSGRAALFEAFKDLPRGTRSEESHAELGLRLGMSPSAVKAAFHRFHRRQAELLRDVVGETVGGPEAIEEELRHLWASLDG